MWGKLKHIHIAIESDKVFRVDGQLLVRIHSNKNVSNISLLVNEVFKTANINEFLHEALPKIVIECSLLLEAVQHNKVLHADIVSLRPQLSQISLHNSSHRCGRQNAILMILEDENF